MPVTTLLPLPADMEANGMGHGQQSFFAQSWRHRFSHGGTLRNRRAGRGQRPLSTKSPLHLVFKVNPGCLRHRSLRSVQGLPLVLFILRRYSQKFAVKIEQVSIQNDHIHALIRTSRRSQYYKFFRVVPGQIALQFKKQGLLRGASSRAVTDGAIRSAPVGRTTVTANTSGTGLWRYRPFSRVIKGWKAYRVVQNYIQLNEQEVLGRIKYQKNRLRGLSASDWEILWL